MTPEVIELDLGKETIRTRPILPLKNAFECDFLAFFKVYFSPPKQVEYMN